MGHFHITDNYVGMMGLCQFQGFLTVRGKHNFIYEKITPGKMIT